MCPICSSESGSFFDTDDDTRPWIQRLLRGLTRSQGDASAVMAPEQELQRPVWWHRISPLPRRIYQPVAHETDGMRVAAEDALVHAESFADFTLWVEVFQPDEALLLRTFDQFLLDYDLPAWETIAYLLEPGLPAASLVERFGQHQRVILALGKQIRRQIRRDGLRPVADDSHVDEEQRREVEYAQNRKLCDALWRTWAYCIVSVEGFVHGRCIVDQIAWLGRSAVPSAYWSEVQAQERRWKFHQENGIFGQCNGWQSDEDRRSNVEAMIKVWEVLVERWVRCVFKEPLDGQDVIREAEETLIHIYSRPTGPSDVLYILGHEEPAYHRLYFGNAIRIVHSRARMR
ncbi:hypothetical protein F4821DRAFT_252099 [Hypoxylon rubiginosum]|uniref:Uncharacterized protein n=1 Tax=Hypoxylon rubiginosum TaxID=110542 RepID=A0ACC0CIE0_9PEZI|nr:hypothetical protein F4821DRAFT_252099 [Hypoxylon rubiginosum]